jgi:hypothetical protein
MRQLIVSIISLLTVFTVISFSQQDTAGATATRIEHIEKGLTEFTSLMDVFNPDTTNGLGTVKKLKTLKIYLSIAFGFLILVWPKLQ